MFRHLFILILIQCFSILLAEFPPKFENDASSERVNLKPFGHHRPPDGPVVEEQGFLHPKTFWEKYVKIHKPMVFRGAVYKSPAIYLWNDQYLADKFGDLDVILEVKRENRNKVPKRMNISSFLEKYKSNDIYAVTLLPDPMRDDVQVPTCVMCGSFRYFMHETNFWMSSGGTRSVIHYDADENLHCIINGSKDFIMAEKKYKKYIPFFSKKAHSGSGFSNLDPDAIDLVKYPDMAKIRWTYTTLYPGDCLYIPSNYLHQVRAHNRTISATLLFTADIDHKFKDTNCKDTTFIYTPLSAIDVHWTYNKGDRTVDMGYMNVEVLRSNILESLDERKKDMVSFEDFTEGYSMMDGERDEAEEEEYEKKVKMIFTKLFGVGIDKKVTRQQVASLPREKLKFLARMIDAPHGPVKGEEEVVKDEEEVVKDGEKVVKDGEKVGKEEEKVVNDEEKVVKDGEKVVKDGEKVVKDGEKVVKDGEKVVKDGEKVVKEEENVVKNEL